MSLGLDDVRVGDLVAIGERLFVVLVLLDGGFDLRDDGAGFFFVAGLLWSQRGEAHVVVHGGHAFAHYGHAAHRVHVVADMVGRGVGRGVGVHARHIGHGVVCRCRLLLLPRVRDQGGEQQGGDCEQRTRVGEERRTAHGELGRAVVESGSGGLTNWRGSGLKKIASKPKSSNHYTDGHD